MSGRARVKRWPLEKVILAFTYHKGANVLTRAELPHTRHTQVHQPVEGYISGAGVIERNDGSRLEYHDVRLYFPFVPEETAEKTDDAT